MFLDDNRRGSIASLRPHHAMAVLLIRPGTPHRPCASPATPRRGTTACCSRSQTWREAQFGSGTTATISIAQHPGTKPRGTGQREESAIGLYYYRTRWYDPVVGRFAQADTIVPGAGNPMAWDRYACNDAVGLTYPFTGPPTPTATSMAAAVSPLFVEQSGQVVPGGRELLDEHSAFLATLRIRADEPC